MYSDLRAVDLIASVGGNISSHLSGSGRVGREGQRGRWGQWHTTLIWMRHVVRIWGQQQEDEMAGKAYDEMNKVGLGYENGWLGCIIQDLYMMSHSTCILLDE